MEKRRQRGRGRGTGRGRGGNFTSGSTRKETMRIFSGAVRVIKRRKKIHVAPRGASSSPLNLAPTQPVSCPTPPHQTCWVSGTCLNFKTPTLPE